MIPVGDSPSRRRFPWVNYGLIVLNLAAFLYMVSLPDTVAADPRQRAREASSLAGGSCYGFDAAPTDVNRFVCKYAFQPKEYFDNLRAVSDVSRPDRPIIFLSLLTALFLHASWVHLLGNMLFLWVFGDNIEDRFGHGRYLLFFLAAGAIASLTQGVLTAGSVAPVVGASGAIAGVLGAYLACFPRARVRAVIPLPILFFIPIPVPAWLMLGLWFAMNLFSGVTEITSVAGADSGVAFFAHVGGFVFGFLFAFFGYRAAARGPRRHPRPER